MTIRVEYNGGKKYLVLFCSGNEKAIWSSHKSKKEAMSEAARWRKLLNCYANADRTV